MSMVKDITDHFAKSPVFTSREIKTYLKNRTRNTKNIDRIISHMKRTGKLYTVKKGSYTMKKDDAVSGFAFSPFYYGLSFALTIRDLWTQNTKPQILTIRKIRKSQISIFDDKDDVVFVHHIPGRYFFGFDIIEYGAFKIPVSDPEKTLIDLFYYKNRLSIQSYGELLKAIKKDKIKRYLKAYDGHTTVTVTNFIRKYKKKADRGELTSPY